MSCLIGITIQTDFALANSQVALRIRRDGERLIQTLKSEGASVAGLSERNEFDWPLKSNRLVLSRLRYQLLARQFSWAG